MSYLRYLDDEDRYPSPREKDRYESYLRNAKRSDGSPKYTKLSDDYYSNNSAVGSDEYWDETDGKWHTTM